MFLILLMGLGEILSGILLLFNVVKMEQYRIVIAIGSIVNGIALICLYNNVTDNTKRINVLYAKYKKENTKKDE